MDFENLYEECKYITTPEQLADFARKCLSVDRDNFMKTIESVTALSLAGAWLGAKELGMNAYSANCIKYGFLSRWEGFGTGHRDEGLNKLFCIDYMLRPIYSQEVLITVSLRDFQNIQQKAKCMLESRQGIWAEREHLGALCNGNVPVGYIVKDENGDIVKPTPISVNTPMHSLADVEEAWKDNTSPYFDRERYEKFLKERVNEQSVCG